MPPSSQMTDILTSNSGVRLCEPHINGSLWCDLWLPDAFIIFERLGSVASCGCGLFVSDVFFNGPGTRENALEASTCVRCPETRMPTIGIVAQVRDIKFVSQRTHTSESEGICS